VRLRIIVTGIIAQYPLGGLTWHYLQYLLGLKCLGHDVYYLEDTGGWPYNPEEGGVGRDCAYNVKYLAETLSRWGFARNWMYRFAGEDQWFGLGEAERVAVFKSADLLLNVSGTVNRPVDYRDVRRLAYIDTDPVFTQLRLALRQENWWDRIRAHDVHFSFGECIADSLPRCGIDWQPTRQPVVMREWHPATPRREAFTTVMNWTSYDSVTYQGVVFGQKNVEFERFIELPGRVHPTRMEIAVAPGRDDRAPRELLAAKGWCVVDPAAVCPDLDRYRNYIEASKGEWSVAKNAYVRGRSGWFSERSACYLASGRPVAVQETGFSAVLPVGEGLLSFTNLEEAVARIREIEVDYARHARAARGIAEEFFHSDKVLTRLIDKAMNHRSDSPGNTSTPEAFRIG
jgi:hypothetical protein